MAVGCGRRNVLRMRLFALGVPQQQGGRSCLTVVGSWVSRGDRNRNARLSRLGEAVPVSNAIVPNGVSLTVRAGAYGEAWHKKGFALLEVALPVLADLFVFGLARRRVVDHVVIGMDPHTP